jgi:two-component system, LytTR family, response regulator
MLYKTLLIDDEKLAISRLEKLLANYKQVFRIIGSANNGQTGLEMIEKMHPDLIFLDIEMPIMNGFEMLAKLSYTPIVIFATAFSEYAIRAFEENSIDYLLKPIEPERLAITVKKLEKGNLQPSDNQLDSKLLDLIAQLQPQKKPLQSISVKIGDKILLIRLAEIAYLEAEDKYVYLHTLEGKKHLLDSSLTALEEKLPDFFIRISRSVIINQVQIREIQKYFNGKYTLVLNDQAKSKLTSGSTYTDKVRALFEL